jgi:hypothetical protein
VKRYLRLAALALAALLAPVAALAAPIDLPMRSFDIHALVLGDTRLEVSGKLWLLGTNLGASVGCNSIGAQVTIDGDAVTILGPATMTEMACPGVSGNAEALLLKIIGLGRFTIADGKWSADGGAIEVVELPASDPNALPPDQGSNPNDVACTTTIVKDGGPLGTEVPARDAPTPLTNLPCGDGTGGQTGFDTVAPGSIGSTAAPIVDTTRDVLLVPLAIGFGLVLLVTAGLLLRGRATPG